MLLDMTISNFRSVKTPQTISFEAVRDNRLPESKVVTVNDKLKLIKTAAIIGPNGAGKSTFVRALEALRAIIIAEPEMENPLQLLAGTSFAYAETKGGPATMEIQVLLDKGSEEDPPVVARYKLVADRDKVFEESLYHIVGRSKKLMFERLLEQDGSENISYHYRWGKLYRGEKKRLVNKITPTHTFLAASAQKGGETSGPLYTWFDQSLLVLPLGLSSISEKYLVEQLTAHPSWAKQLVNFFWSLDITDIRDVRIQNDKVVFVHTNVTQHYAAFYATESLSLRRLSLMGVAFFESFISPRTVVLDDFGLLLHPDVLRHVVEIFEACNTGFGSQMLAVDCNPSLLKDGLMRRDGIWFAQKDSENATVYYSLADFKYSRAKERTTQLYLSGAYGALPITSEFCFVRDESEEA